MTVHVVLDPHVSMQGSIHLPQLQKSSLEQSELTLHSGPGGGGAEKRNTLVCVTHIF